MIRILRFTAVLLALIAFAWTAVPTSPAPQPAPFAPANRLAAPENENAAVALADMRDFAGRGFVVIKERPETFRTVESWGAYELRWMTFEVVGGEVRVYHATSKADHAIRYTFLQHDHDSHGHGWEQVR